jgi:hypothetical protein
MISKFAKLEFLLKLDKKGKEWLPQDSEHASFIKNCQEVLKNDYQVTVELKMPNYD